MYKSSVGQKLVDQKQALSEIGKISRRVSPIQLHQGLSEKEASIFFSIESNFYRVRKKLSLCPYCSKEPDQIGF